MLLAPKTPVTHNGKNYIVVRMVGDGLVRLKSPLGDQFVVPVASCSVVHQQTEQDITTKSLQDKQDEGEDDQAED